MSRRRSLTRALLAVAEQDGQTSGRRTFRLPRQSDHGVVAFFRELALESGVNTFTVSVSGGGAVLLDVSKDEPERFQNLLGRGCHFIESAALSTPGFDLHLRRGETAGKGGNEHAPYDAVSLHMHPSGPDTGRTMAGD